MRRRWTLSLSCALLAAIALSPSLLFGSIEDQRARLPPAAEQDAGADCSDPAAGTWLGQQYNQRSRSWQRYELTIRRASAGSTALVGEVRVHFWNGWYSHSTPQTDCSRPHLAAEVVQNATGTINGLDLSFGGNDWRTSRVFCQPPGTRVAYNPDHFTGTINVAIQEFQSVNNDGGSAVNEPVVFRRIRCAESAAQPRVVVVPPVEIPRPPSTSRPRPIFGCSR
ncbi:MAG: hypothetical protein U0269_26375 [Polyangiales bacterium]